MCTLIFYPYRLSGSAEMGLPETANTADPVQHMSHLHTINFDPLDLYQKNFYPFSSSRGSACSPIFVTARTVCL